MARQSVRPTAAALSATLGPLAQHPFGLLSARPAATGSGVYYLATDDGAGVLYQDTAAGVWSVAGAARSKLAHVRNTSTATAFSTASNNVNVPGMTAISVPKCSLDVWCIPRAYVQQTAGGSGAALAVLYDDTSGTPVFVANAITPLPNSTGTGSKYFQLFDRIYLGPLATAKVYRIVVSVLADAGQTPACALVVPTDCIFEAV